MKKISSNDNKKLLIPELIKIVGKDNIIDDEKELEFFSSDIFYESSKKASLVISPKSSEQTSSSINLITSYGIPVIPRGGGMSYTGGYTPFIDGSVIIDLRKLNNIKHITHNEKIFY